jgi:hypothetical protein
VAQGALSRDGKHHGDSAMAGLYGAITSSGGAALPLSRINFARDLLVHSAAHRHNEIREGGALFGVVYPELDSNNCSSLYRLDAGYAVCFGHVKSRQANAEPDWSALAPVLEGDAAALEVWQAGVTGNYSIALVDPLGGRAAFFTDPFGGFGINYLVKNGSIFWACELKFLFLASSGGLQPEAFRHFIAKGYCPHDLLYVQGAKALRPGRMLHWARETGVRELEYKRQTQGIRDISYSAAKAEFKALLERAVLASISGSGRQVCVTLSGGLDSRTILCIASKHYPVKALTYGVEGSIEVDIAKRVAKSCGLEWRHVAVGSENWLNERERAVWITDAQVDIKHLHIAPLYGQINGQSLLDGFCGDVTLGQGKVAGDASVTNLERLLTRADRFTRFGPLLASNFGSIRMPLVDDELVQFMERLPLEYKLDGRIYHDSLGEMFPIQFGKIPWSKTARPPYPHRSSSRMEKTFSAARRSLTYLSDLLGVSPKDRAQTMHYTRWVRARSFRQLFRNAVYSSEGVLRSHVEVPPEADLFNFLRPRDLDKATRILTLELWLRALARCGNSAPL